MGIYTCKIAYLWYFQTDVEAWVSKISSCTVSYFLLLQAERGQPLLMILTVDALNNFHICYCYIGCCHILSGGVLVTVCRC